MLRVFVSSLLPVFLAAGAGYVLSARLGVRPRPLSQVAFHLLAPCLVFRLLVDSRVPGDSMLRMAGFAAVTLLAAAGAAALVAWLLRWPRSLVAATAIVVLVPNAGNYGLAASRFAFGEDGLAYASVFFVTSAVLAFTVGVLVASLGRLPLAGALGALPKVPAIWAVAAAVLAMRTGWKLPLPLERVVYMFADACVPMMLIVLGTQLQGGRMHGPPRRLALATGLRLAGGLAFGLALAPLFGLAGVARQAGILEAAMPSAVMTTILASQYDLEPEFVSSVVFASTFLSPITLAPLLVYLGA